MAKRFQLKFNAPAPEAALYAAEGGTVNLSSLWSKQTLVLAFIRHFGCPQCKEMLSQMVRFQPELTHNGLSLAVITQAEPQETADFCAEYAPGLRCLSDPQRRAYAAYGLGRGKLTQTIFSPRVWLSNWRLKSSRGWNSEMPPAGQDAFLMSGIFIIGTDGRIRLPYYYDDIADHPSLELLVRGVMGVGWQTPFDAPITPG